jgi:hypothetical protein
MAEGNTSLEIKLSVGAGFRFLSTGLPIFARAIPHGFENGSWVSDSVQGGRQLKQPGKLPNLA